MKDVRPVIKRVVMLFFSVFILTSIGDVWTTELGRQLPNTVELNPAGFQPLLQSILGECCIGALGVVLVALGATITADTLAAAKDVTLIGFVSHFQARFPTFILVFVPIAIAELRVIAVVNNFSILVWGDSPIGHYVLDNIATLAGLPDAQAFPIMIGFAALIAYLPVMWTIHAVCKST